MKSLFKRLISLSFAGLMIISCTACGSSENYYASRSGLHADISGDAHWMKYDSDNIWGIEATVVDYNKITYIFDAEKCLFNDKEVEDAFSKEMIYGCDSHGGKRKESYDVVYEQDDNKIYLTFAYGNETERSKVGGFWLHMSDDEYIRCGFTDETIYIDHVTILSRGTGERLGMTYEMASGEDWTQLWKDGRWSEKRNRGYYWDDGPVE